jgi:hypothetical protein
MKDAKVTPTVAVVALLVGAAIGTAIATRLPSRPHTARHAVHHAVHVFARGVMGPLAMTCVVKNVPHHTDYRLVCT